MASNKRASASADDHVDEEVARGKTAVPKQRPSDHASSRNAFSELMKPKPKPPPKRDMMPSNRTTFYGRDGLAAYTTDPTSFPQSRVVYYNDKFVVINDLYPKATVHLLILPRDRKKNVLRPQEAFDDPVFLAECMAEVKVVREIVAAELRRKLGSTSASEKARNDALDSDDPDESALPEGRNWDREILSGTHANPSMNHLHIHVLSRDMHSECLKKKNHYLSFTTDFFIPMSDYPLVRGDFRREYHHFTDPEMKCWRCGRDFGNRVVALKEHLEGEFQEWRRE